MAISEATKREVQRITVNLKQQADALKATKQEYQDLIQTINGQLADLKSRRDTLIKDIPEPISVEV